VTLLVVFAGLPGSGKSVLSRGVADAIGATLRFVEVRCSDEAEHRRRVESRQPEMPGQHVPTWDQVRRRRFEPWPPELSGRLVVDNVGDATGHVARIVAGLAG
jgi:hypothetical protein